MTKPVESTLSPNTESYQKLLSSSSWLLNALKSFESVTEQHLAYKSLWRTKARICSWSICIYQWNQSCMFSCLCKQSKRVKTWPGPPVQGEHSFFRITLEYVKLTLHPLQDGTSSDTPAALQQFIYRSISLSRDKKVNWKLSSGRSQENECYKRLIYKQFVQVSGLCGPQFMSYLPKRFTHLCRALYETPYHGVPFWCINMAAGNQQKHLKFTFL